MKKIIFILVVALSFSSVYAQNTTGKTKAGKGKAQKMKNLSPEEKADKVTGRLKTELTLTDEQTPKVRELALKRATAISEAKKNAGEDKAAFKAERKKIFQSWDTDLKNLLSADQNAKYQAKKEAKKKELKEKKAKSKAGGNVELQNEIEELEDEVGE